MPKEYDPYNWYWLVGGDTSKTFSSASGDYVPADNPAFIVWKSDGSMPTNILNEAELGEVLAPYNIRPASANVLDGYKEHQARELTIKTVAKVLFNLVNEVRVLKGQQPVTAVQFKAYLKGLM